jgi:transposase
MKSRRAQLLKIGRRQPERLVDLILNLEERLRKLEDGAAQNSRNSGQPPSTDGLRKPPVNLRPSSQRRPGGQPGHPGQTLAQVKNPDQVKVHCLDRCPCGQCAGVCLRGQAVQDYEKRQVFDLPPLRLEVTEHRAEIKLCPVSGQRVRALFPPGVQSPTQYGPGFQGFLVYLSQQQLLPYDRLRQICEDLLGQPLSAASLVRANQRVYERLAGFEGKLMRALLAAAVLHVDESGLRVASRLHWLHVASTAELTFYGVHAKRGVQAMDALGVLPLCSQWLVHDHWKPYYAYQCLHALCNQHLLRELKFLAEEHHQDWAQKLAQFLRAENENAPDQDLSEAQFKAIHARYKRIVRAGRRQHPRLQSGQGRSRQSKAANLLDRLEDYDLSVLAFMIDRRVPFTNNQAEQDIRMIKVQQKISGCFRTLAGARMFARIRSYLSTCRKQGHNLWQALQRGVLGKPFMPRAP